MHTHFIKRTVILFTALTLLALGAPAAQAQTDARCFPETGQCVSGRFRQFWEQNGGLAVFGYPITPVIDQTNQDNGQSYQTQWFERNRFELHPENAAPYDVLLGRLGADRLRQFGRDWFAEGREDSPQPGCLWFAQTGHNVCDQASGNGFKTYWSSHGLLDPQLDAYQRSLALFGLPLTTARPEVNFGDNQTYITQWFERARFEWHPDEPAPYVVLLGLLGNEIQPVQQPVAGWTQVADVSADVTFNDVFMQTNDTAVAAGEQNGRGVIYRFAKQNGQWRVDRIDNVDHPLHAVVALPGGTTWTVGAEGSILRAAPGAGFVASTSLPGVQLNTLQMFSDDEGWAGGAISNADGTSTPVLLRYTNGTWQRDPSITGQAGIVSLHFVPGEGWAVTSGSSETAIWHYRNGTWQQETLPQPCESVGCLARLRSMHAAGPDSVWAVGDVNSTCAVCTSQVYALHRVDGQWQVVLSGSGTLADAPRQAGLRGSGFYDVYVADDQNGMAVGYYPTAAQTPQEASQRPLLVARFRNGQWSYAPAPHPLGTPRAVSMTDANHALVVGSDGMVLSYEQ